MKIRSDFVTNSSSSSYVVSYVETKSGNRYQMTESSDSSLDNELYINQEGELILKIGDGLLSSHDIPIQTVEELATALLFQTVPMSKDAMKSTTVAVSCLFNRISLKEMVDTLGEFDGFEELQEIDIEDGSSEIRETVLTRVGELLEDIYEIYFFSNLIDGWCCEEAKNGCEGFFEEVRSFQDIKNVSITECEYAFGENVDEDEMEEEYTCELDFSKLKKQTMKMNK